MRLLLTLFCGIPTLLVAQLSTASFELFVNQQLEAFDVPGISIGVLKDGEVLLAKGFGQVDPTGKQPVGAETQFAIGSATKSFTAAAIGVLIDQGKVALDEPVRTYLPWFTLQDDYASTHLTVRDLLRHNSGLPRHDLAWYGHEVSRRVLVERLRTLAPTAELGKKFQYQNLMYATAGLLVEEVSGQTWEAFTHQYIMAPLGMNRSNFSVIDMAKDADYARPYGTEKWLPLRNLDAVGPAGSINSTANDVLRYLRFQLGDGKAAGKRVLSDRLLAEMHTPQMLVPRSFAQALLFDDNQLPLAYGLGWFIGNHRGKRLVEHGGNIDGYTALVSMLPDENIGVVILCNANGSMLPAVLRNRIYDELLELDIKDWTAHALRLREQAEANAPVPDTPLPDTRPSLPLAAYAGTYVDAGYGELRVLNEGDSLYIDYGSFANEPFAHFHHDVFANADEETLRVQFQLDMDGKVAALATELEPALPPVRFLRQASAAQQNREQFFIGEYTMMGTTLTVYKEGDQLVLVVPGQPEYPLTHKTDNEYTFAPGFAVVFAEPGNKPAKSLELRQPHGNFTAERVDEDARRADRAAAKQVRRKDVSDHLGKYTTGNGLDVELRYNDGLQLEVTGQPVYTLLPTEGKDRFRVLELSGFFVQLSQNETDEPRLIMEQPNGRFNAEWAGK